jgi:hypothetical protein
MTRLIYSRNGTSKPDVVVVTKEDCHADVLFAPYYIRGGARDAAMDRSRMQGSRGQRL